MKVPAYMFETLNTKCGDIIQKQKTTNIKQACSHYHEKREPIQILALYEVQTTTHQQ